jgi:hypothetical protein
MSSSRGRPQCAGVGAASSSKDEEACDRCPCRSDAEPKRQMVVHRARARGGARRMLRRGTVAEHLRRGDQDGDRDGGYEGACCREMQLRPRRARELQGEPPEWGADYDPEDEEGHPGLGPRPREQGAGRGEQDRDPLKEEPPHLTLRRPSRRARSKTETSVM